MFDSVFITLPVKSVKASIEFFTALGFTFNQDFSDEETTCMIVNETIYVMLGEHKNYLSLIDKPIADPASSEVILTLSCSSPRRDSHHHFNGNLSRCTPSERT